MNCRPDDIAVIVYSTCGKNVGALVHVLRPTPSLYAATPRDWEVRSLSRVFDTLTNTWLEPGKIGDVCDDFLRPIRPGDVTPEEVERLYSADIEVHA